MDIKFKNNKTSSLYRFIKYTFKHKILIIFGNISLIISSLAFVVLPYICGIKKDFK